MSEFLQSPFKDVQTVFSPEDAIRDINESLRDREHLVEDYEVRQLLASRAFFNQQLEQEGIAA